MPFALPSLDSLCVRGSRTPSSHGRGIAPQLQARRRNSQVQARRRDGRDIDGPDAELRSYADGSYYVALGPDADA